MPSSAKNIRNDSRIPFATLVAAKAFSAATSESSDGEDFCWLKPSEQKTVSVSRTESTFFNAILPERDHLVGGVDAANHTSFQSHPANNDKRVLTQFEPHDIGAAGSADVSSAQRAKHAPFRAAQ